MACSNPCLRQTWGRKIDKSVALSAAALEEKRKKWKRRLKVGATERNSVPGTEVRNNKTVGKKECTSFLYRTTFVVLPAGQVGSSAENTMTAQAGAAHWGLGYS
jgi:hypothetical protein